MATDDYVPIACTDYDVLELVCMDDAELELMLDDGGVPSLPACFHEKSDVRSTSHGAYRTDGMDGHVCRERSGVS